MVGIESTGLLPSRSPVAATPAQRLVSTYLDHLAVERGSSPNTLSSYRRDLRRYLDYLAGRGIDSLAAVDSATVGGFLAALREGDADHPALSASSAARAVVAVRGLHKFGYADGELASDVAREVKPPVPPRRLPKAIPVEDVERLLEAAGFDQTPLAVRDRALLELLYGTGARISEAVGLDVDDLDLDDRTVLLRGKGGKQRLVPLGSYAARALSAYLVRVRPELVRLGRGTPRVFLNSRGGVLSRQSA
ncbi:MAG TPA: tyrosine-type recombinase/integrase, partial [Jatrophihabitans sp.]|nr:tyrosine-type recombinase/integrase [Jatrophihabitans sp.]